MNDWPEGSLGAAMEELRQAFKRFVRNAIEDKWFLPALIILWFATLVGYILAWAFIPGGC